MYVLDCGRGPVFQISAKAWAFFREWWTKLEPYCSLLHVTINSYWWMVTPNSIQDYIYFEKVHRGCRTKDQCTQLAIWQLGTICCRQQPCKAESKKWNSLKLRSTLLSPPLLTLRDLSMIITLSLINYFQTWMCLHFCIPFIDSIDIFSGIFEIFVERFKVGHHQSFCITWNHCVKEAMLNDLLKLRKFTLFQIYRKIMVCKYFVTFARLNQLWTSQTPK